MKRRAPLSSWRERPIASAATRHRGLWGWHEVGAAGEPSFAGSWGPLTESGAPESEPLRFMLDDYGLVHIHGQAETASTGGTIFTLPAGFRPPHRTTFLVGGWVNPGGGGSSNRRLCRLDVQTNGNVVAQSTAFTVSITDRTFRR